MLSVGLITFNEELRLERTLKAVQGLADEIVVVDSFSTDGTVEIAQSFGAKVEQISWPGYGMQKNIKINVFLLQEKLLKLLQL